jgi:hypothetical protein
MKELLLDKKEEIEANLKQHLSLINLIVMLYWRYVKPYKILYIYLSISKGYDVKVAYYTAWYCNKKDIYNWINKLKI